MWLAKWHSWADEGKFPGGFFIRSSLAGEAVGKFIVQLFKTLVNAWHWIIFKWRGMSNMSWAAQTLCRRQNIMFCTWCLPWWRIRIFEFRVVYLASNISSPWGSHMHLSLILNGEIKSTSVVRRCCELTVCIQLVGSLVADWQWGLCSSHESGLDMMTCRTNSLSSKKRGSFDSGWLCVWDQVSMQSMLVRYSSPSSLAFHRTPLVQLTLLNQRELLVLKMNNSSSCEHPKAR